MVRGAILSISTPPAARIAAAAVTTLSIRSSFSFLPRRLRLPLPSLSPFTYIDPNRIRTSSVTPQHLLPRDKFRAAALLGGGGTMLQDAGATVAVMAGAYGFVSVFDNLAKRNIIEQSLSRKLVHILSGLLFMGCWPIFSTSTEARYFASLVPLANGLRLVVHGLSLVSNEDLIKAVTREGKPEELLRGPLYYVAILILSSLVFWRESPVGVISLAMMCGGMVATPCPVPFLLVPLYFYRFFLTQSPTGVADIMGRRFGSLKLPYNQHKSWAGSISMFIFGFLISMVMLHYFSMFGYFQLDWTGTMERVALVSLVATVVESLPTTGVVDDNLSVPLASMLTAFLSFGY